MLYLSFLPGVTVESFGGLRTHIKLLSVKLGHTSITAGERALGNDNSLAMGKLQLGSKCFLEKIKLLGGLFFNKMANVSAVRRQQQHQSQESLQTEFVDCFYDTV